MFRFFNKEIENIAFFILILKKIFKYITAFRVIKKIFIKNLTTCLRGQVFFLKIRVSPVPPKL